MNAVQALPPSLPVRLGRATLGLVAGAGLFTLLYAGGVPCMFAKVTHHPCPGYGSTRAVIAFLHGDLDGVVRFNPLGPAVALLIGIFAAQAWFSLVRWGDFRDAGKGRVPLLIKRALIGLAVVEFLLWVARFFGLFGGPVPV